MGDTNLFKKNLDALGRRRPELANELKHTGSNGFYSGIKPSRDGFPIPVYASGSAAHSLYNPAAEAERTVGLIPQDTFPVFLGLGAGFAVRNFLARYPESSCAGAELDRQTLVSLLSVADLSDILENPRFTLIPSMTEEELSAGLKSSYLPALQGGLYMVPPNPQWLPAGDDRFKNLERWIQCILKSVSADYSVQAHFGRLWNRNFWLNLKLASEGCTLEPVDTSKIALIAAAGPGLEDRIADLLEHRDLYCIIAADTAYSALAGFGITADYFVSIDGQHISSMHAGGTFLRGTTVILELCGNAELGRLARRSGVPLFYTAGEHPLSRIAAAWCGIPSIRTGSGTVTMAAWDVAHLLGFKKIEFAGADFRYARGKPYARGTYLADLYGSASNRVRTGESLYTALMFRSPVTRAANPDGSYDYRSDVLDSYAVAFRDRAPPRNQRFAPTKPFNFRDIQGRYQNALRSSVVRFSMEDPVCISILPFLAWYRKRIAPPMHDTAKGSILHEAIQLALTRIEGYTYIP